MALMPVAPRTHQPRRVQVAKHNPRGKEARERQSGRAMHTGSKAWRMLRAQILIRDRYTCAVCGHYGDQVDHLDNDAHNNQWSNLQTLCASDHSAKTMRERNEQANAGRPRGTHQATGDGSARPAR